MKMTSAEANKMLRKLQSEREMIIQIEAQSCNFVAAVEENPDDVRPDYDFKKTNKELDEIERKIRKIKHAINVFNTTHYVKDDITIDEALVKIPMLTQRSRKLESMAQNLPKSRIEDRYNSSTHIEYRHANYKISDAKELYQAVIDELNELQLKLDDVNRTVMIDIDI